MRIFYLDRRANVCGAWSIAISLFLMHPAGAQEKNLTVPPPAKNCIRVATFNVALNRKEKGQLAKELEEGDAQAAKVAAVIQLVGPDILLTNELDYDDATAKLFLDKYLSVPQPLAKESNASGWKDFFTASVNTGVDSGLDLNYNGRVHDSDDAWGYGAFPGQYGMVVYSKFPIESKQVRTFQKFLWSKMPNALRPKLVDKQSGSEKFFHEDKVWNQLRLSSKSHWDVPVQVGGKILHVIASHPTPPVFDGPEDRNGCRNHDEIRMIEDYVTGGDRSAYLTDDLGNAGGLGETSHFVIVGDLNADPLDGSGISSAIQNLLNSPRVAKYTPPASDGAKEASTLSGNINLKHKGDPANDTGDFNDNTVGNLRIDFVLPSSNCKVVQSGVFWPTKEQSEKRGKIAEASDHHLVWVDIQLN